MNSSIPSRIKVLFKTLIFNNKALEKCSLTLKLWLAKYFPMKKLITFYAILFIFVFACKDEDAPSVPVVYDPTPYVLEYGDFPTPNLPADNPLTNAKVQLGRMLFYDKQLSKGNAQSCADCHLQKDAFSDIRQFSIGVEEMEGKRQAMPVMNLAWHEHGMFWDGRAPLIRDQSLLPIIDPLEMNETYENVIKKLSEDKRITDQFIRAFGDETITTERMSLAMEAFMLTMVSFNSKYDKYLKGEVSLTESEERGRKLFFAEFDPQGIEKGGECFHCHGGFNFTNDEFMNNGLDADGEMADSGRMKVTNNSNDEGKFKVPSLRNIELTPPYMHDGRFETLEEVLDHYNTGVKQSSTVEFILQFNMQPGGLQLSDQDKSDLIAFMKTLTDPDFISNPAFSAPE